MARRLPGRMFGFSGALTLSVVLFAATFAASQPAAPAALETSQSPQPAAITQAPAAVPEAVSACLACHEDKSMEMTFADGSTMSLFVDLNHFTGSVHASQLTCTDCHAKYDGDHPMGTSFASRRAYTVNSYQLCKKCHFDTYTRTL